MSLLQLFTQCWLVFAVLACCMPLRPLSILSLESKEPRPYSLITLKYMQKMPIKTIIKQENSVKRKKVD